MAEYFKVDDFICGYILLITNNYYFSIKMIYCIAWDKMVRVKLNLIFLSISRVSLLKCV